jgi:hypothetical protein
MKNYRPTLLAIIALCFLFTACKKDQQATGSEFSATKTTTNANSLSIQTASWKASTATTGFYPKTTKDTLVIAGIENDAQATTANLTITLKQKGAGTYKGSEIKAYFYYVVGGDAISGQYLLDPTADNQVVITSYDETAHVLKGTFNLTFKNAFVNYTTTTIKLSNGKINVPLANQFIYPIKY